MISFLLPKIYSYIKIGKKLLFFRLSQKAHINFVKYFKISTIASLCFVVFSIGILCARGLNLSIDFTGGILLECFENGGEGIAVEDMRTSVSKVIQHDFSVQAIQNQDTSKQGFLIKIGFDKNANSDAIANQVKDTIIQSFPKTDIVFNKVDYVSPQIGSDMAFKALLAVLTSILAIVLYVAIRFDYKYAVGGTIALLHDAVLTLGFASLFSIPFDMSSVAAILTVLGYSINDSVVIYDRIRGIYKKEPKISRKNAINQGLNATLSRTTLTVVTVLLAVLAIILFGGSVIRSFAIITFFGVVVGTFSSIFISASALLLFKERK